MNYKHSAPTISLHKTPDGLRTIRITGYALTALCPGRPRIAIEVDSIFQSGANDRFPGKERTLIKEAAIKKNGTIYTGFRHDRIIKACPFGFFKNPGKVRTSIQGFVTDTGEFLNRKEAGKHAFECGQTDRLINNLTSEDLW